MNNELYKLLKKIKHKRSEYVFCTKNETQIRNNVRRDLLRIAEKADIKKQVTPHVLRHSFASHLVMNGTPIATVKELMGHAKIETTMIYAHLAPKHLKDSVDKLKFGGI